MPRGPDNTFLFAPHCFHPTDSCPTCFYTISRHNGALTQEGGAPSHPITVITAVIRAAVDRKGESPRRPQAQGHHPDWEEEGAQGCNNLSQAVLLATQLDVAMATFMKGHISEAERVLQALAQMSPSQQGPPGLL